MNRESLEFAGIYAVLVTAWGLNYVFVRIGLQESPPLWLATERAAIGLAGCLILMVALRRRFRLRGRDRRDALLIGIPNTTLFFGLWFLAAVTVPPGQTAVIIYTFPLWVALLSGPVLHRPLAPLQWVAIAGGFSGVILVAQPWVTGGAAIGWVAGLELLAAAVLWATATVWYKRRFPGRDALETNTYQLLGGTLGLLGASLLFEPSGPATFTPTLVLTVLWLGLVGTALAYFLWFTLLSRYRASSVSAYTFLVPVVALGASVLVTGEMLAWPQLAGVVLILVSIFGVAMAGRLAPEEAAAARSADPKPALDGPKGQ